MAEHFDADVVNPKNKKRTIIIRICWATFFILALAFLLCLPSIVKSFMIAKMKTAGLVNPQLNIRGVGLTKLDVQALTLGDPQAPALEIPALSVDYSLPGLFKGKIKKIDISGMRLQLDIGPTGINLEGLETKKPGETTNVQDNKETPASLPFNELAVHSSLLRLNWQDQTLLVPFEITAARILAPAGDESNNKTGKPPARANPYSFSGNLYPLGEKIAVSGTVDISTGNGTITVITDNARLHRYLDDFPLMLPFLFESRGKLGSQIHLENWQIKDWDVSLAAQTIEINFPRAGLSCNLDMDFKMDSRLKPKDIHLRVQIKKIDEDNLISDIPFDFNVSGEDLANLRFSLADIHLQSPHGMIVREIDGTADLSAMPGNFKLAGKFRLEEIQSLLSRFMPGIEIKGSLAAEGQFRVETGTGSNTGDPGKTNDQIEQAGNSSKTWNVAADLTVSGQNVVLEYGDFTVTAGKLISQNHIATTPAGTTGITGSLAVTGANLEGIDKKALRKLPENEKTTAAKTALTWLSTKINLFEVPWHFTTGGMQGTEKSTGAVHKTTPAAATQPSGHFVFESFKISGLNLGEMLGTIAQEKNRPIFSIDGRIITPVKELQAGAKARFCFDPAEDKPLLISVSLPSSAVSNASKLGRLHPAFKGYQLSGNISADCEVMVEEGLLNSTALIKLDGVDLIDTAAGITCRGIKMELEMKDLLNFSSAFTQVLAFKELEIGGLKMGKGQLQFRIESPEAIFVEGGRINFCSGKLLLYPFRYMLVDEAAQAKNKNTVKNTDKDKDKGKGKKQDKGFTITLFCDRVDFDEMVNLLMGRNEAKGDAELNGILPITIVDGLPVFDDAYLYSTPGTGGKMEFTDSKTISGGVLIVEEAMKDFNYEWVKVKMNSTGDRLNMIVFIKGTPADKLPLTYDMKKKDIVYDKHRKKRLELKGLTLELRFTDIDLRGLMKQGVKLFNAKK